MERSNSVALARNAEPWFRIPPRDIVDCVVGPSRPDDIKAERSDYASDAHTGPTHQAGTGGGGGGGGSSPPFATQTAPPAIANANNSAHRGPPRAGREFGPADSL